MAPAIYPADKDFNVKDKFQPQNEKSQFEVFFSPQFLEAINRE